MPMVWESPKEIEPGLAEALAIYLYQVKGKLQYSERSLEQPTITLEFKDIEATPEGNTFVLWWIYVKRAWEKYKPEAVRAEREWKEKREGKRKRAVSMPIWIPAIQFFGSHMVEELNKLAKEVTDKEMEEARKELRELIGFSTYAYQKREMEHLRD